MLIRRSAILSIFLLVATLFFTFVLFFSQKPQIEISTTLVSKVPFPSGTSIEQSDAFSERLKKIDSLVAYFSQRDIQKELLLRSSQKELPDDVSMTFSANATTVPGCLCISEMSKRMSKSEN